MEPTIRQELLANLHGVKVQIYDLHRAMPEWPHYVNTNVETLREDVQARLASEFTGKRKAKLEAADPAWFGASWWPYANIEELRIATYLAMWLFAWDDETDSPEISSLSIDYGSSQRFRTRTLMYVRSSLGFEIAAADQQTVAQERDTVITSFGSVGEAVCSTYSPEKRQRLLDELEFFITMQAEEQSMTLQDELPAIEQYRQRRMGTSAVGVCLAITEYCYQIRLPLEITQNGAMKWLWDETNVIISTVNDVLSVRKELRPKSDPKPWYRTYISLVSKSQEQGQVDTIIPLLFHRYREAQIAVDITLSLLETASGNFEKAAALLLQSSAADKPSVRVDIHKFIDACRYACTANLEWSLRSKRYKLMPKAVPGGMEVTL